MNEALKSINSGIAQLELLRDSGVALSPVNNADLAVLVACRELLQTGNLDLRLLVGSLVKGRKEAVALACGIRKATLIDFLKGRTSLRSDSVTRVIQEAIYRAKTGQ